MQSYLLLARFSSNFLTKLGRTGVVSSSLNNKLIYFAMSYDRWGAAQRQKREQSPDSYASLVLLQVWGTYSENGTLDSCLNLSSHNNKRFTFQNTGLHCLCFTDRVEIRRLQKLRTPADPSQWAMLKVKMSGLRESGTGEMGM
jgi:hypothetical protein